MPYIMHFIKAYITRHFFILYCYGAYMFHCAVVHPGTIICCICCVFMIAHIIVIHIAVHVAIHIVIITVLFTLMMVTVAPIIELIVNVHKYRR